MKQENTKRREHSVRLWRQGCSPAPTTNGRTSSGCAGRSPLTDYWRGYFQSEARRSEAKYPWILKGGYAMELRIRAARTTKDIDLTLYDGSRLSKDPGERRNQVRAMLQESASIEFKDYFEFLIGQASENLDGAPEGGSRHPVEARMDGREFARFHVDVGIGDEVLEPVDVVEGRDWLRFGGITPPSVPVISREQQFAEKLHAYSLPRGERVNTRTKDLIDMLLLIEQ